MVDPDRPFKPQDPYEDDVSGQRPVTKGTITLTTSGRQSSTVWSLLTVIAALAFIGLVALTSGFREQQAQQRAAQMQTIPSTTGSAPAR